MAFLFGTENMSLKKGWHKKNKYKERDEKMFD